MATEAYRSSLCGFGGRKSARSSPPGGGCPGRVSPVCGLSCHGYGNPYQTSIQRPVGRDPNQIFPPARGLLRIPRVMARARLGREFPKVKHAGPTTLGGQGPRVGAGRLEFCSHRFGLAFWIGRGLLWYAQAPPVRSIDPAAAGDDSRERLIVSCITASFPIKDGRKSWWV